MGKQRGCRSVWAQKCVRAGVRGAVIAAEGVWSGRVFGRIVRFGGKVDRITEIGENGG